MRTYGRLMMLAAFAVFAVGMAGAQPFGGFGKGKGAAGDYFTLVNNGQIRGELKLTDEQAAKLPAAALEALAKVLDKNQLQRLKQISLQQKGNSAYLDGDVKKELKITDDQAKKIQTAIDKQNKETQEMFQNMNFDFERIQELAKEATDTVQGVLTAAQKDSWKKMTGEPFEMKGFGGKGFGKKQN